MKNTVSNINIINTILEALHRSEEDIRRRAADKKANGHLRREVRQHAQPFGQPKLHKPAAYGRDCKREQCIKGCNRSPPHKL